MILQELGIYGWKEQDENLLAASLLTGDPLLLIGNHGCAKTHVANKVAQALGRKFLVYDASKAMFEDVLGYPNVEKLKHGVVEYVPSPVTVWDKELILIDELNRAVPELQSKWLEIIRSRKIMGFPTEVKWVWAAMNPMSYSATNALDEALIGRFAMFIYPPDVLDMDEADRIRVTTHINGDDAPSLNQWRCEGAHPCNGSNSKTVSKSATESVGEKLTEMLRCAAGHFELLRRDMGTLSEFLAKFADLLMRESQGEISLDGRRLGFIYRNILANRAVELAKAEAGQCEDGFAGGVDACAAWHSARYVVQSSIPIGLNDESVNREEAVHKIEICFDLLSSYFGKNSEIAKVNRIYELFTTPDLMRKAEILLTDNLGDMAESKAWTDLVNSDRDITLLAYTALQIETRRPGTVFPELIESLSKKIDVSRLSTTAIPDLQGEFIEYIDEIERLLDWDTELGKLVAFNHVTKLAGHERVTLADIDSTRQAIDDDIEVFGQLISQGGAK